MSDGMMISTVLGAVEKESLFSIYAAARPVVTSPQVDVAMLRGRLATAVIMLRSKPESAGEDVAGWSAKAKMGAMLRQMPDYLTGVALLAFESLISNEGLEFLIGSTLVLAAAQEFGIGELADAGLVAWAWWSAGRAGLNALADLLRSFVMALKAQNSPDIRRAAALCASALVVLGISALILLNARAGRKKGGGKDEGSDGQSEPDAPVVSRRGIARSTVEADGKQAAAQRQFSAGQVPAPSGTGATFNSAANLQDHFARHGGDFGATTATDYEARADAFLTGTKPSGVLEKIRSNGDFVRFDPVTNEFGVASQTNLRTYYKPDPAIHGYPTNLDYFNAQ